MKPSEDSKDVEQPHLPPEPNPPPAIEPASNEPLPSLTAAGSGALGRHVMTLASNIASFWKEGLLTVKKAPWLLIVPLVTCAVLIGCGEYGVHAAATNYRDDAHKAAASTVAYVSQGIALQLASLAAPNVALAAAVRANPYVPTLAKEFVEIANTTLRKLDVSDGVTRTQIIPWGKISGVFPYGPPENMATLNYYFWTDPARINVTRDAVAKGDDYADIIGPLVLIDGTSGFVARYSLYIKDAKPNETFGMDTAFNVSYALNKTLGNVTLPPWQSPCGQYCGYMPGVGQWWGLFNTVVRAAPVIKLLDSLTMDNEGTSYRYVLFRRVDAALNSTSQKLSDYYTSSTQTVIFYSKPQIGDGEELECHDVSSSAVALTWAVCIVPTDGWDPSWLVPLQIAVAFISTILSGLLMGLLVAMHKYKDMFAKQVETNEKLTSAKEAVEVEKSRMDVLLKRQFELINCFAQNNTKHDSSETSHSGTISASKEGASKESMAMDRIEAIRRNISTTAKGQGNTGMHTNEDDIKVLEMLGEGTFGKVFKALWRGSVVAVKAMVLPANMSGAEKREKMAIMEAAISSSLAHPNIVQTFTYSIKPVKDTTEVDPSSGLVVEDINGTSSIAQSRMLSEGGMSHHSRTSTGYIHSYEVRLVLEYCDKGCLRDALDQEAFFFSSGLNYKAILDTAADIAKAMLHLHLASILHGDLKARNVMLKSAGSEGRGVLCKVADFGLAVKIDHQQTHMSNLYQGTMTHMAPEIMLEGRVSKAADVYAFGVTMWEIFTGGHAFQGTPRALLGHQITREHKRPAFPIATPAAYRELATRCWDPLPEKRPTFEEVLSQLLAMREEQAGPTPPLGAYHVGPPPEAQQPDPPLEKVGASKAAGLQEVHAHAQVPVPPGVLKGGQRSAQYKVDAAAGGAGGGADEGAAAPEAPDAAEAAAGGRGSAGNGGGRGAGANGGGAKGKSVSFAPSMLGANSGIIIGTGASSSSEDSPLWPRSFTAGTPGAAPGGAGPEGPPQPAGASLSMTAALETLEAAGIVVGGSISSSVGASLMRARPVPGLQTIGEDHSAKLPAPQ